MDYTNIGLIVRAALRCVSEDGNGERGNESVEEGEPQKSWR